MSDKIKLYGNYFKLVKGYYGVPQKISIIKINDENVMYVYGHYSEEECKEIIKGNTLCVAKMTCKKESVIIRITEKQRKCIDEQHNREREKQKILDKIFHEFDIKIPLLSWSGMEVEKLEEYYEELEIQKAKGD